ncbi:MAG: hypothetical protein QG626_807 [Patescibacteria group bacterium]|nr:hypothetical protein [Patescibacteria group bacterium]
MHTPVVHSFFDKATFTVTHIVADPQSKEAVIIDSVMDYNPASGKLSHESADNVLTTVSKEGYKIKYILETHAHADHITAAQYLKKQLNAPVCIGENITTVQKVFKEVFNEKNLSTNGDQFDILWKDGDLFTLGQLQGEVIFTPGHTPADVTYRIGDTLFVGDTIFMPDFGTARCDFPGGNAETLHTSIKKLLELPEDTKVFMCHDYLPEKRTEYAWETTIKQEKEENIHLVNTHTQNEFIQMRNKRDAQLDMPRLIIPSIQINIRAGNLPEEENGISYLKTPINGAFSK